MTEDRVEQLRLQALGLLLDPPENEPDAIGKELREFWAGLMADAYEHITTLYGERREQRDAIAALEKQVEDAREAIEPIAELYRLLFNQAKGFELMRAGVSNGDFQRIALLHKRLSLPLQSGDIGDQEASGERPAEGAPKSGE